MGSACCANEERISQQSDCNDHDYDNDNDIFDFKHQYIIVIALVMYLPITLQVIPHVITIIE